ncbi:copper resistance protein CopC [Nocardia sp. NPDC059239]|uniref:copper resistance CopC family protein n=1 Tax=unclassified Nocardia TaxID=2637762 RepID=UPI0036AB235C
MSSNKFMWPGRGLPRLRPAFTVLAAALIGATMLGTGVADAHSHITHAEPADGAVLQAGPPQVSVTFNEKVDDPELAVSGPDGNTWSVGDVHVDGRTLSVDLAPLGPAGVYTTHFTVTSKDGHRIEGQRTFTLAQPGDGTAPQQ